MFITVKHTIVSWRKDMTAKTQTEAPAEMAQAFANFDYSKVMDQFTKMMGEYKFGAVDVTPFVEIQRKNLEALVAVNKLATENMQTVFKRQTEIQKKAADEFSGAFGSVTKVASPSEAVAAQAELVKDAYGKTVASMTEINDLVVKGNQEVLKKINGRFAESLDEFKTEVLKLK